MDGGANGALILVLQSFDMRDGEIMDQTQSNIP